MDDNSKIDRWGGDKIGLLGLLVLSLIAARLTVAFKSSIALSEPIPLPHTGLSMSVPNGNGWRTESQWMYDDHTFILRSVFAPRSDRATAWANCQYCWAAKAAPPEDRFAWKASEIDGEIVETGQIQADTLTIDWAHIERPDFLLTTFWGTTKLPNGRQLDIEVHQILSDPELPGRIFNRIVESISFKTDALLDAGAEVVAAIKSEGLNGHLTGLSEPTLFLIRDPSGQSIGFTMETLMDAGTGERLNVRGAGFLYNRGRNAGEQERTFRCSNHLDAFAYTSRLYSRDGRSGTQVVFDETGGMTVTSTGSQLDVKKYYPGPAALPDFLFDAILRQMLDSDKSRIAVDLIDAGGQIIPTTISRIEQVNPRAGYAFKLESLVGSQKIYLDEQRQISRRLIQHEGLYVLARTSAQNIAREFPEHAKRILRSNRVL
ncbi:MAG: hypothetical protein P8Z79_00280 [Sedimentisphaerales bacterium]|jgi:hypothetical protein